MAELSDLVLSITPPARTLQSMPHRQRARHLELISEIVEPVFEHYRRTCRFCGYQENSAVVYRTRKTAAENQPLSSLRLVPANGDPTDLTPGNHTVACLFCDAVNSVNTVESPDAWSVIYLPSVPQFYLSWIARAMFVVSEIYGRAVASTRPNKEFDEIEEASFKIISETLRAFSTKFNDAQLMAARYKGFGSMATLSQCLIDMAVRDPDLYDDRARILTGFRIVPRGCLNDDWSFFFKYRTLIQEATPLSGLRTFRDMVLVARQTYKTVYNKTFPTGDPLKMELEMGGPER